MSRFLFAGGGTGGHITPGLSIAEVLRERGHSVVFVTSGRAIERRFLESNANEVVALPIEREGETRLRTLRLVLRWPRIARRTAELLRELRPDVVMGTGGRVTYFALAAARRAGLKTALLEVNAEPGKAVRWLEARVDRVLCGFERTRERLKNPSRARWTGVPIRGGEAAAGVDPGKPPRLLVLGGSQGSRMLNDVVSWLAPFADREGFHIDHLSGDRDHERCSGLRSALSPAIRERWELAPFATDVGDRLANCHLVLARAGASTVAEVQAAGRPAVFVPYPHHRDEHQAWNARALGDGMVLHRDVDGVEVIGRTVRELLGQVELRERMAAAVRDSRVPGSAAERCARELEQLVPT